MCGKIKKYVLVLALAAVVLWSVIPHRLPSIYAFNPIQTAEAQLGGGNAMNLMMMIMMLMMMMSLMQNNNLQGKQGERLNQAAPRLLTEPYGNPYGGGGGYNVPPGPNGVPQNPQTVVVVPPQQPGINVNIPLK